MADPSSDVPPGDCPACGTAVLSSWRHCPACGAATAGLDADEPAHHVTVVVSDLQGSTALAEGLDPESLRLVLDRYFDELGAVLESHGGRIEKRIGDMMVTVFGLPRARPDDAVRALRAAMEVQQTLAGLNERLEDRWGVRLVNRTGVATGEVVHAMAGGGHRILAGEAFDTAAALEPIAPALEVLVAESTVAEVGGQATFDPPAADPFTALTTKAGDVVAARRLATVREVDATQGAGADHAGADGETIARSGGPRADDDLDADDAPAGCPWCGAVPGDGDAWCTSCGTELGRAARRRDSRRKVTIVFADLQVVPADRAVEPAAERRALLGAFETAREVLEHHGGVVERFIGDAVMAVFGLDRRHEDDALRATRAALEVQERLAAADAARAGDDPLRVEARVGVNTGPVVAGDPAAGERLVTGDAVNVAARLEQTAHAGAVVVGGPTRRLLGPAVSSIRLEPLELKGKSEPVEAHRVLGVDVPGTAAERFELPFVGRRAEVQALEEAWAVALSRRCWRRVDLWGEAGIGKSRVLHEWLDGMGASARVLRGSCPPYGRGITFWPVAEIVRSAVGVSREADADHTRRALATVSGDPAVAGLLGSLLGLDAGIAPVAELFWAVRRFLEHLASQHPLVVVLDGAHRAEPTLVDLLEELVGRGGAVPVLVVTMNRPEGAERGPDGEAGHDGGDARPDDGDGAGHSVRVDLRPLDEATCEELLAAAIGHEVLPGALRAALVRASGGVPLFIEQLLTMLVDDGRLTRTEEGWALVGGVSDLQVPPTVEAILAARVDALGEDERRTVDTASVVGREFGRSSLQHLTGRTDLGVPLRSLVRRQLVVAASVADALADHRFRSLLLRDVVYDSLLKRDRAELHRRYGDWLAEGPGSGRAVEFDELVGHHLERSFQLGAEVGPVDGDLASVGRRAAEHLGDAGARAFARGDMPAAASLLGRAADLLPADPGGAALLLVLAGDASFEEGAFDVASTRYARAQDLAAVAGDEVTRAHAALARVTQGYLTGDGVDGATAQVRAAELEAVFAAHGDDTGIARCWRLRSYVELTRCQWGAAERAASLTLEAARRAGDAVLERRVLPALAGCSLYGPTPVPQALARCDELLDAVDGDRRARALIERSKAQLLARRGDLDAARSLCAATRASLTELGWNFDAALVSIDLGPIELMAGRPEAAERELRADRETLLAMGEDNYLSTTTFLLAEAVRRRGHDDEALALADEAATIAAEDDVGSQAGWRGVRARVLLGRGHADGALALAEEALELVLTTDEPAAHAEALLDRAAVRAALGDLAGARADALLASERSASKGDRVGASVAERFLSRLR